MFMFVYMLIMRARNPSSAAMMTPAKSRLTTELIMYSGTNLAVWNKPPIHNRTGLLAFSSEVTRPGFIKIFAERFQIDARLH